MSATSRIPVPAEPDLYEADVIAWAKQQAELLRAGRLEELDVAHIAEEIEDVGKSEQRELANRMTVLLMHLLKWQYQPERRGSSWRNTIAAQRQAIAVRIKRTPSLQATLRDPAWWEEAWADAVAAATAETGLGDFPTACPWALCAIQDAAWLPDDAD
jgi:hypothetical protein